MCFCPSVGCPQTKDFERTPQPSHRSAWYCLRTRHCGASTTQSPKLPRCPKRIPFNYHLGSGPRRSSLSPPSPLIPRRSLKGPGARLGQGSLAWLPFNVSVGLSVSLDAILPRRFFPRRACWPPALVFSLKLIVGFGIIGFGAFRPVPTERRPISLPPSSQ